MVVSADPKIRALVTDWIEPQPSHVTCFDTPEVGLCACRAHAPDLLVLDIGSEAALSSLEQFRASQPHVPIVAVTTAGTAKRVVRAMRLGAFDVLSGPFTPHDVSVSLGAAQRQHVHHDQMAALEREVRAQSRHTMLFGAGEAMAEVRGLIADIVDTDVPVLIRGESGTGKELVARAIAAPSLTRGMPFVKINCAALPSEMIEAELFGFERGAFTGAFQSKPGKFEMARGGTIFLDEIGELAVDLQSKLLQVLQDGHFARLGGHDDVHVDVRVIAATNRDLDRAVAEGRFRADLLFRLDVIPMSLPPLRERRDDIPSLAEFFLKRWTVQYNRRYSAISPGLMGDLVRYAWPGNIRELENLIRRTVILGSEASARSALTRGLSPPQPVPPPAAAAVAAVPEPESRLEIAASFKTASRSAARRVESIMIDRMLRQTGGSLKQTAINLQISYKTLLYKCKENSLNAGAAPGRAGH
jgi:DNA-binding NtrC family response regulator